MFWKKVVEKIKTHISCSITFFRKSHRLWDNVEKCSGDRGATNDVTIWRIRVACCISTGYMHVCACTHQRVRVPTCITHTQACTHRPACNIYCFSTATMVSWTRLIVTLYVHCLYCLLYGPQTSPDFLPKKGQHADKGEHGTLEKWYWQGTTEVPGGEPPQCHFVHHSDCAIQPTFTSKTH